MKKIFKITLLCLLTTVIINCEDNERSPLPENVNGAYVLVNIENPVIDVTAIETSTFGGTLIAPANNVARHEFSVRRVSEGVISEFAPVFSATSFPADFQVGAVDIATALGISLEDILPGDRFDFIGTTTGTDGSVVQIHNLSSDLIAESGQRQAYELETFVSCPFSIEEAIGTYTLTNCTFSFCNNGTFEIIAGENPNEVIMVNPYNSSTPFNITVMVDPLSAAMSISSQPAFETDADAGFAGFGPTSINTSTGFFFSCTGSITTVVGTSVPRISDGAIFSFGSRSFEAQKQL